MKCPPYSVMLSTRLVTDEVNLVTEVRVLPVFRFQGRGIAGGNAFGGQEGLRIEPNTTLLKRAGPAAPRRWPLSAVRQLDKNMK